MNTEPLKVLGPLWPNDQIQPSSSSLSEAMALFTTPAGQNYYSDRLVVDEKDGAVIAEFAAANDLTYSARGSYNVPLSGHVPAWHGYRTKATAPMVAHVVSGHVFGYEASFQLEYVSVPNQREGGPVKLAKKSVIRVTLPKLFPQLVLESNKNDPGYISTIPTSIKADQRTALEGTFSDTFEFFVPKGLQIEALSVLAPNFMELLLKSADTFDVEFYGRELILTTRAPIYTAAVMETAVAVLRVQLKYLERLMTHWDYTPRTPPFDRLQYSYVNGEVLKVGPLRLSPIMLLLAIALGFVAYGYFIIWLNSRG